MVDADDGALGIGFVEDRMDAEGGFHSLGADVVDAGTAVLGEDFAGRAAQADPAVIEPEDLVGKLDQDLQVVTDNDHGVTAGAHLGDVLQGLDLEAGVAGGEGLVHEEDLGGEAGGDREAEAGGHAGTVVLDGHVHEALEFGEGDDLGEEMVDVARGEAEERAVEIDVFEAGEFGMEAGAEFEEGADAAAGVDLAGVGGHDAGEDLEQGRFAGAVEADQAEGFALLDLEGDVAQGVKAVMAPGEALATGIVGAVADVGDAEVFGNVVNLECDVGQSSDPIM